MHKPSSDKGVNMTHHIIASIVPPVHRRQVGFYSRGVFQRGKGKIGIIQPGQADTDWITEAWLKEHRHALPPGTVIIRNGVTFSIAKE